MSPPITSTSAADSLPTNSTLIAATICFGPSCTVSRPFDRSTRVGARDRDDRGWDARIGRFADDLQSGHDQFAEQPLARSDDLCSDRDKLPGARSVARAVHLRKETRPSAAPSQADRPSTRKGSTIMSPGNFGVFRKLVLAALVGGSSLAVPAAARAESISAERALLGHVDAAPAAVRVESAETDPVHFENASADGERALLGKSERAVVPDAGTDSNSRSRTSSVNGATALLSERKI
jgi:hypothetical protein